MNHTPTPWKFSGPHTCEIVANVNGLEGYPTIVAKSGGRWDGEAVANGAYIVQCVNAHAALVEENAKLKEILWAMVQQLALWPGETNPEYFPCMKDARAALALAEKGA